MVNKRFNPTESTKEYIAFPSDEYVDVCILSYQQADLPPGPLATTNDPVPSVRFLFGGHVKDENGDLLLDVTTGQPIIARKWTKWMKISNGKRAALMTKFDTTEKGFPNLFDILNDCETPSGKLWSTPFKILLEDSDIYQNIVRIKPGTNKKLCETVFYDDQYVPFKVVKAFGNLVPLTFAACKLAGGIEEYTPDKMVDPIDNA